MLEAHSQRGRGKPAPSVTEATKWFGPGLTSGAATARQCANGRSSPHPPPLHPEPSQTQAPVTPATEPERRAGGGLTTRVGARWLLTEGRYGTDPHQSEDEENRNQGIASESGPLSGKEVSGGRSRPHAPSPCSNCHIVYGPHPIGWGASGPVSSIMTGRWTRPNTRVRRHLPPPLSLPSALTVDHVPWCRPLGNPD